MARRAATAETVEQGNQEADIQSEVRAKAIEIPKMALGRLLVRIVGDGILIVVRFSEEAKRQIREKDEKKAKQPKQARNPKREFVEALHFFTPSDEIAFGKQLTLEDQKALENRDDEEESMRSKVHAAGQTAKVIEGFRYGFPAQCVKKAMVEVVGRDKIGLYKTTLNEAIRITAYMLEIKGSKPILREDAVRNKRTGITALCYRAQFMPWYMDVPILYRKDLISAEQIVNVLSYAGFSNGLGANRVQKGGTFGTFHVEQQRVV